MSTTPVEGSDLLLRVCETALRQGASDIHCAVGQPPMIRVHGQLRRVETDVLTAQTIESMMKGITGDSFQVALHERGGVDFSFSLENLQGAPGFRVNVAKEHRGLAITLRLIPTEIRTAQQIGLTREVIDQLDSGTGLFLVTGATGSGKSTTLAAMVDYLAQHHARKIVTVEQPIEFRFSHGKSLVTQQEVPIHSRTFADSMRFILRQDPDVIMVGELRDLDDIRVALQAAESGHLVLSTVHSKSAGETVDRLVNVFPASEQNQVRTMLSTTLLGILSQDLVPRLDGTGRIMVSEIFLRNDALANLIRKGETERIDGTLQTCAKQGMRLFDDHLFVVLKQGLISPVEALHFARRPIEFRTRMQRGS